MKPRFYIETSVISYLTARPSRDLVTAGHQMLTREFWELSQTCEFVVSQLVRKEAARGDSQAAQDRLQALKGMATLDIDSRVVDLAQLLVTQLAIPTKAIDDAYHVAAAAVYAVDYLASWNCTHIVNVAMRRKIEDVCMNAGYTPAIIATPEELLALLGEP